MEKDMQFFWISHLHLPKVELIKYNKNNEK